LCFKSGILKTAQTDGCVFEFGDTTKLRINKLALICTSGDALYPFSISKIDEKKELKSEFKNRMGRSLLIAAEIRISGRLTRCATCFQILIAIPPIEKK